MQPHLPSHQSLRVQCLRAFACTLLVAYHLIGPSDDAGLKVAAGSVWRQFELLATPLRMPLFTFLSGYIYAARRQQDWARWRPFMQRKAKRLWLPYLSLTPLYLLGQFLTGREQQLSWQAVWDLYWVPHTFYWFLSALFIIFLVVSAWELYLPRTTLAGWAGLFGVWWALNLLQPIEPNVLGIGNALYLGPCFLAGLMLRRYGHFWNRPPIRTLVTAAALAGYLAYMALIALAQKTEHAWNTLLLIPLGCLLSLLLIRHFPVSRWMVRLGHYSYSIFLFHLFFITAARIALTRLGITDHMLLFLPGLAVGLAGPVLVEKLLRRWHWSRLVLLGQPQRPGHKPGTVTLD